MGWRDLFGAKAQTTEDLMAQAEAARPAADRTTGDRRAANNVAAANVAAANVAAGNVAAADVAAADGAAGASSAQVMSKVEALARSGEKIEAIKLYREHYGVSLVDAKNAVEALLPGAAPASKQSPPAAASGNDASVKALADSGELIQAIKLYRELHGGGLKEAKDAVDAMRA